SGRRSLTIHSAPDGSGEHELDSVWTRRASGTLAPAGGAVPEPPGGQAWPPPEAVQADLEGLYERLRVAGLGYGPVFQGLRAAWPDGEPWYAEVALPEDTDTRGYGIHPALLDAALHTLGLDPDGPGVRLPFAWAGIRLHASDASTVRVTITPTAPDTVSIAVA